MTYYRVESHTGGHYHVEGSYPPDLFEDPPSVHSITATAEGMPVIGHTYEPRSQWAILYGAKKGYDFQQNRPVDERFAIYLEPDTDYAVAKKNLLPAIYDAFRTGRMPEPAERPYESLSDLFPDLKTDSAITLDPQVVLAHIETGTTLFLPEISNFGYLPNSLYKFLTYELNENGHLMDVAPSKAVKAAHRYIRSHSEADVDDLIGDALSGSDAIDKLAKAYQSEKEREKPSKPVSETPPPPKISICSALVTLLAILLLVLEIEVSSPITSLDTVVHSIHLHINKAAPQLFAFLWLDFRIHCLGRKGNTKR